MRVVIVASWRTHTLSYTKFTAMKMIGIALLTFVFAAVPSVMHADAGDAGTHGFFASLARAVASPFLGFMQLSTKTAPLGAFASGTTTVAVTIHACPPSIGSGAEFDALGGFDDKSKACPAVVFGSLADSDATAPVILRLRSGEAGKVGDGLSMADPALFGTRYEFRDVPRGDLSLVTVAPGGARFGALEFPYEGERAPQSVTSYGGGIVNLDTRLESAEEISVHIFNFTEAKASVH